MIHSSTMTQTGLWVVLTLWASSLRFLVQIALQFVERGTFNRPGTMTQTGLWAVLTLRAAPLRGLVQIALQFVERGTFNRPSASGK